MYGVGEFFFLRDFLRVRQTHRDIKTVQKAAAARGITVAEYRDKILFPHGKKKILKRFEQYYKLKNKVQK